MLRRGSLCMARCDGGQEWEVAMMRRPRRTVRMRLTGLYCGLFVVSAVVLLAITNGVGSSGSSEGSSSSGVRATAGSGPQPDASVVSAQSSTSHQYLFGSVIALGVMAVASVVAGWVVAGR